MEMKIGARLTATFGAVLVLLLVICVTVSAQMAHMNEDTQSIVNNRVAKVNLTNQLKEGTYRVGLLVYRALDERTPEAQQATFEQLKAQVEKNTALYQDLESRMVTAVGRVAFDRLMQVRTPYSAALKPVYAQLAAHDSNGARATLLSVIPVQTALLQGQDDFLSFERGEMDAAVRDSRTAYDTARAVLWGAAALAVIIALILCTLVTRSMVRPLQRVVDAAKALARGDLSVKIDVVRRDEVGALAESVNEAIAQLAA